MSDDSITDLNDALEQAERIDTRFDVRFAPSELIAIAPTSDASTGYDWEDDDDNV